MTVQSLSTQVGHLKARSELPEHSVSGGALVIREGHLDITLPPDTEKYLIPKT